MNRIAAILILILSAAPWLQAQESLCAEVRMEITQELTLERQAFDAAMRINNGLPTVSLEDVDIDLVITDVDGTPVAFTSNPNDTNALFYVAVDDMGNISDINGDHGLDACLGHGLSADECLAITFEVVPPSCPVPNLDVDCTNIVTVTGHTELCSPDNNPCGPPQTAVATVDVRCPGIACDKCVCADVDTNENGRTGTAKDAKIAKVTATPRSAHFVR